MYAMDHTAHFEHRPTPEGIARRLAARARAALFADSDQPRSQWPDDDSVAD